MPVHPAFASAKRAAQTLIWTSGGSRMFRGYRTMASDVVKGITSWPGVPDVQANW